MRRTALLAALAIAGALVAPPASAASPTVVYELVRVSASAPPADIGVTYPADGAFVAIHLEPFGRTYRYKVFFVGAGRESVPLTWRVALKPGERFVVGGPRGGFTTTVATPGWRFREVRTRLTAVRATRTAGGDPAVETLEPVRAPGGQYGSFAFSYVPCDPGAGLYTLRPEPDPLDDRQPKTCSPVDGRYDVEQAPSRVDWFLDGTVHGVGWSPYRLLVLDYPALPSKGR